MCLDCLKELKQLQKDRNDLKRAKIALDFQINAAKQIGCWDMEDGEFRQMASQTDYVIKEAMQDINVKIDMILQIYN